MYNKEAVEKLTVNFNDKEVKKLRLAIILRLLNKLNEEAIVDEEIEQMVTKVIGSLDAIKNGDMNKIKDCNKLVRALIDYVRNTLGFVTKGTYPAIYMGIGMIIGSGIGVTFFMAINPAFMGLGTGAGIALGLGVGSMLEKKADKEGKLY